MAQAANLNIVEDDSAAAEIAELVARSRAAQAQICLLYTSDAADE